MLVDADEAVLEALETELLDPVVVSEALRQATTALIDSPEATAALRDALDRRAVEIATSIERWTAAISAGGDLRHSRRGCKHVSRIERAWNESAASVMPLRN